MTVEVLGGTDVRVPHPTHYLKGVAAFVDHERGGGMPKLMKGERLFVRCDAGLKGGRHPNTPSEMFVPKEAAPRSAEDPFWAGISPQVKHEDLTKELRDLERAPRSFTFSVLPILDPAIRTRQCPPHVNSANGTFEFEI